MKQRIATLYQRVANIEGFTINMDEATKRLNDEGWEIRQISSTSFQYRLPEEYVTIIAITLLLNKKESTDQPPIRAIIY